MNQQLDLALSTQWDDVAAYGFDLINGDLNMLAVKLNELFEYDHEEVEEQINLFDHSFVCSISAEENFVGGTNFM